MVEEIKRERSMRDRNKERETLMECLFKKEAHHSEEDLKRVAGAMEPHSPMGYLVIPTTDNHVILPFSRPINNGC